MPTIVENKLITLNSRYAQKLNGTFNSSMIFNFRGILVPDEDIISSNICVMNAQLPVSWYIINETNYYFILTPTGQPTIDVYLTFGNYNGNTLIAEILARIAASGTTAVYGISINQATGKLTFTCSVSSGINCPSTNPIGQNFSARVLGFTPDVTVTGASVTAPFPLNLLGINRLAVRSNLLTISSYNSVNLNLGITLSTIPVDVPAFSLLNYTNQTDLNKAELKIKTIDAIDILIVDEENLPVNFNNIEWTMTLVLENVRRVPELNPQKFSEMVTPVSTDFGNQQQQAASDQPIIGDVKELELLNA
jgi:hypothetical protein